MVYVDDRAPKVDLLFGCAQGSALGSKPARALAPEVIRDNLHLVLAMSPAGSQLRSSSAFDE